MNSSESSTTESVFFGALVPEEVKLPLLLKGIGHTSSRESLLALALPPDAHIAATTCVKTFPNKIG
jgi:hypothetical protein